MRLHSASHTHVGMKRSQNEDRLLVEPTLGLFAVADGMGGHAAGETASRLAVETVRAHLAAGLGTRPWAETGPLEASLVPAALRQAVEAASRRIAGASLEDSALEGMGTTLTALLLGDGPEGGRAWVAHVGDSRAYLVRGEILQQLTDDHTLVGDQVRAGVLDAQEARISRMKNVITRSVGYEEAVEVDVLGLAIEVGDLLLLCSDGLTNAVADDELARLTKETDIEQLPEILVDLANARGGEDNVSVVAVQVADAGLRGVSG